MNNKSELTSLSFFSGCLGLDLGLEKAGIHQLMACDFEINCRNTIAVLWILHPNRLDTFRLRVPYCEIW